MILRFQYQQYNFETIDDYTCQIGISNNQFANAPIEGYSIKGKVVIPSFAYNEGKSYKVVKTSKYAFKKCTFITSIAIPKTLEYISLDSFWNTSVTELMIPRSVKFMENFSLSTMLKLEILIFEEGISISISNYSFHDCMSLHTIILPVNIIYPETGLFHKTNLERVFICSKTVVSNDNNQFWQAYRYPTIFVTNSYKGEKFFGIQVRFMENERYFCPNDKKSYICNAYLMNSISLYFIFCILL